jgi:hypothetical protein
LLCERFPSPGAEESMELCQQLKQVNTVDNYIDQFEDWMTAMRKGPSLFARRIFPAKVYMWTEKNH